jgi:hypothetical protein
MKLHNITKKKQNRGLQTKAISETQRIRECFAKEKERKKTRPGKRRQNALYSQIGTHSNEFTARADVPVPISYPDDLSAAATVSAVSPLPLE